MLIFAFGLLLRAALLLAVAHQPLASDSGSYFAMARSLSAGQHFLPFWPPALPLYLSLVARLVSPSELAARCSMLVFYVALALVVYLFAGQRSVFAGNVALLLLALSPGFIFISVETLTELPAALLVTLIVFLLVKKPAATAARVASLAMSIGATLGCLLLLRPSAMLLAVVVPICLVIRTRRLMAGAFAAALAAVFVLGWISFVYRSTGRLVSINTSNSKNFYLGNNSYTPLYRTWWLGSHHELEGAALALAGPPQPDPILEDRQLNHAAWTYIRSRPLLFVVRTFNRACVFVAPDTFSGSYLLETYHWKPLIALSWLTCDSFLWLVLGTCSLATLYRRPGPASRGLVWLAAPIALFYSLPYLISFSHPRYHVPLEPLAMIASAIWLDAIVSSRKWRVRRGAFLTLLSIFAASQVEFIVVLVMQVHSR